MNHWIVIVLLLATSVGVVEMFDNYGETCRRLCACEEKEGILTVECESRGIVHISEVSPVYFTTYHLLLTGNLLKRLSANDFVEYNGLTILHLGNNDISNVESGAFNGLQGLKRLHLNSNKIDALTEDLFVGLESLEYLQLDYNSITHVEPKAFSKLRHLEVLILNDNLISTLPTNIFQYVPLTHLDLRGNQLKLLPYSGLLEHMDSVVELQLEENPWNCSCELIALKAWLESISYTALVGDVVCEFPFRLHGRDLDEVSKQELCPRRAIAEYEMRPQAHQSTDAYFRTTPASVTAPFTSSAILRSSSRPTKGPHQSGKLKSKPTSRIPSNKPQNYGQIVSYQTKSPVPLDCPTACTCNLQISDLGLNVNCQERKIERISDLIPKPYNPKKMYLTGNFIPVVRRSDFVELTGLDLLHLGNNLITHIYDRAFGNLTHLRRLYLNGNLIDRLTVDMFFGLESLQFLYLEYNIIREIVSDTFQHVPNLQLLFLNNNLLKTLPGGIFHGLTLSRLNLRNNHLRNLPVSGVLGQLTSLVQVDLFENPWDCRCSIMKMKMWLEQLSTGTVVDNVICGSPKRLFGEDMRYIKTTNFCPNNSDILASMIPPSEESVPGSTITIETSLDYDTQINSVPLSVVILSLLLIFIVSVFVAAGLFAAVTRRRQKTLNEQSNSMNVCISSLNMEYGLYKKGSIPKVRTSAGHVYEYIPPPTEQTCKNTVPTVYRPMENKSVDGYRDFDQLNVAFLNNHSEEEAGSNAISSEYSVSTPLNKHPPLQDDVLDADKPSSYSNTLPCRHTAHSSNQYNSDFNVRHQYMHPERIQQTILYCTAPSAVYVEPNRSEYWELKAKLHSDPDYLEVLEKRTTFTQF
ncbi:SLIT and NTRK-like protein 5 [Coregonus clupeaformis]|uniref:SLIT and NTRK-like protein 5 n=1 Tax=Coregonus clupeaformis TaxID=59861 RepID=UPI001BDF73D9|nr:SLIT and NTRK-like protein 5 [Coregonus clupeaformis]XP_041699673.1 SLIT and NTRK-like protein 5 [Coregonus clupeaformis]XP_041699674.1 SLIT and NTRK-like protein 5 [Coregonus clupeaformis]